MSPLTHSKDGQYVLELLMCVQNAMKKYFTKLIKSDHAVDTRFKASNTNSADSNQIKFPLAKL